MSGDPRLTAFALGECDGAERAEVEALIARDPEARVEVEAVRAAAGAVEAALAGAAVPALEAGRRAVVERELVKAENPVPVPAAAVVAAPAVPPRKPRAVRPLVGAAAAMALLGMGFGVAGYSVAVGRGVVLTPLPNFSGVFLDEDIFVSNVGEGTETSLLAGTNFDVYRIGKDGREISSAGTSSTSALPLAKGRAGTGGGGKGGASYDGTDWFTRGVGGGGGGAGGVSHYYPTSPGWNSSGGTGGAAGGIEPTGSAGNSHSSTAYGFGGGAGGGGHQYLGVDNGGVGLPRNSSGKPGSGSFYNDHSQDQRGRPEAIALSAGEFRFRQPQIPPGVTVTITGTLPANLLSLKDAKVGGVPVLSDTPVVGYLFRGDDPADLPGFDRLTVGGGVGEQTIFLPRDGTRIDGSGLAMVIDPRKVEEVRLNFKNALDRGEFSLEFPNERMIEDSTTETFAPLPENPWIRPVGEAALSTFSVDVDTAAYSIVRRCLTRQNRLPPPGAVRIEELVNYFPYEYAAPSGPDPFAVLVEAASCPWEPRHRLVRVALKGRVVDDAVRPAANLVFLVDVSGSMGQPNKLPLVQESMKLLVGRLDARDRVAIVVYAGASGLVLPSTRGNDPSTIIDAIGNLSSGGSTNGGAGIELAYRVATENFIPGGINRVILATDGDFNVGIADQSSLVALIEEKAKSKVFLTALGFGMDNLKDSTLEQLADRGNGNYGYVDDLAEARRILVEQGMSTLHTIAKDVKIQVEFNPAKVAGYRLLGYENRVLAAQDFTDDRKDAGEIGAGHAVTAFYEVVPAGQEVPGAAVDELRYQRPGSWNGSLDTLTVKLRWKEPEGDVSTPREIPFTDAEGTFDRASEEFRFAAAVVQWGLLLRGSRNAGGASFAAVQEIASGAMGGDEGGWKAEFLRLVTLSAGMKR